MHYFSLSSGVFKYVLIVLLKKLIAVLHCFGTEILFCWDQNFWKKIIPIAENIDCSYEVLCLSFSRNLKINRKCTVPLKLLVHRMVRHFFQINIWCEFWHLFPTFVVSLFDFMDYLYTFAILVHFIVWSNIYVDVAMSLTVVCIVRTNIINERFGFWLYVCIDSVFILFNTYL